MVKVLICLNALTLMLPLASSAKMVVDQYYGSNAVLQHGVELPVSGDHAAPGEEIVVSLSCGAAADVMRTRADAEGKWRVSLPPQAIGGPYTLKVTGGAETLVSTNLLAGEVWLVSGQSNAYFPIERFAPKDDWLKDADYPRIRFMMTTTKRQSWYQHSDPWLVASPETVAKCSATGFFFAKELQKASGTRLPVGVVVAAVDGSYISRWMPGGDFHKLYIKPLAPFPVKGVIWYQGESDGMFARGYKYRFMLQEMIRDWRGLWHSPELPFLVVQLPHFNAYDLWYEIRDSQNWLAQNEPSVTVVPTLDIGDLTNIHPPRKPELGARLSLFARKYVYGEKGLHPEGPVFRAARPSGNEMIVAFDVATAIKASDGESLRGFQVAGADGKFRPATGRIVDAKTIAVTSPQVKEPVAVRYGFVKEANVNFSDAEGNAAGAFRSDNFKLPTQPGE